MRSIASNSSLVRALAAVQPKVLGLALQRESSLELGVTGGADGSQRRVAFADEQLGSTATAGHSGRQQQLGGSDRLVPSPWPSMPPVSVPLAPSALRRARAISRASFDQVAIAGSGRGWPPTP